MAETNKGLIAAILFATLAVTGSLVFLGIQISNSSSLSETTLAAKINEGIQQFVQDQQDAQKPVLEIDSKLVAPINKNDHIYGDKDAPISLIEYSDFLCPYCYQFHDTAKQIVDDSNGQVNWIFRHFPLGSHDPEATMSAIASECIAEELGEEPFWTYSKTLFDNRANLSHENLIALGTNMGANEATLTKCIDNEDHNDKVQANIKNGIEVGVSGTPGNILINHENNKAIRVSGAQPIEAFNEVIRSLKE